MNHHLFWILRFITELEFATIMLCCWTFLVFQCRAIYLFWTTYQLDIRILWIHLFGAYYNNFTLLLIKDATLNKL